MADSSAEAKPIVYGDAGKAMIEKARRDREQMQRNAFTRWCNSKLKLRRLEIKNMEEDLAESNMLCHLLEVLSGTKIAANAWKKDPKMRIHKLGNVESALKVLEPNIGRAGSKLVGIGADDIVDKNLKLQLGLIWRCILKYHLSAGGLDRNALLEWCNRVVKHQFPDKHIKDFGDSFVDSRAFLGINNYICSKRALEPVGADPADPDATHDAVFTFADATFDIPRLIEPEEMHAPDELAVMTYVAYFKYLEEEGNVAAEKSFVATPQSDGTAARTSAAEPYKARCGVAFSLFVHLVDTLGKLVTLDDLSALKITVTGPDRPVIAKNFEVPVTEQGIGRPLLVRARCMGEQGAYKLTAKYDDIELKGSPLHIAVGPGGADAENSYLARHRVATGDDVRLDAADVADANVVHVAVGVDYDQLHLYTHDPSARAHPLGDIRDVACTIAADGGDAATPAARFALAPNVSEENGPPYALRVHAPAAGRYTATCTLHDTSVLGAPFTVVASVGGIVAERCRVLAGHADGEESALDSLALGDRVPLRVVLADQDGAPVQLSPAQLADALAARIGGDELELLVDAAATAANAAHNAPGTLCVAVSPPAACSLGAYELSLQERASGAELPGAPLALRFTLSDDDKAKLLRWCDWVTKKTFADKDVRDFSASFADARPLAAISRYLLRCGGKAELDAAALCADAAAAPRTAHTESFARCDADLSVAAAPLTVDAMASGAPPADDVAAYVVRLRAAQAEYVLHRPGGPVWQPVWRCVLALEDGAFTYRTTDSPATALESLYSGERITETGAVCLHLAQIVALPPPHACLRGAELVRYMEADQRLAAVARAANAYVLGTPAAQQQADKVAAHATRLYDELKLWERYYSDAAAAHGDVFVLASSPSTPSVVDLTVFTYVAGWLRSPALRAAYGCDSVDGFAQRFPRLAAVYRAMFERPSVKASWPPQLRDKTPPPQQLASTAAAPPAGAGGGMPRSPRGAAAAGAGGGPMKRAPSGRRGAAAKQ